jgi:hypothetical protein
VHTMIMVAGRGAALTYTPRSANNVDASLASQDHDFNLKIIINPLSCKRSAGRVLFVAFERRRVELQHTSIHGSQSTTQTLRHRYLYFIYS